MSQPKKSNFLPLLLIGGGVAGAALLYGFGTKQSKEDISMGADFGVGGSGDFLGSSGISKGYDSADLGIEDYAFNRATPEAFSLPSDGAANPEKVVDESGAWTFADTAVLGLTAAATVPTVVKGVKSVGSKVASSGVGQAVKSTTAKVSATTAGKALSTVGKGAGVLGLVSLVDTIFDVTGLKEAHFSQGGLTGNLQGVNTSFSTTKSTVTTDTATKESVGNMVTPRQQAHAVGLSGGKYPITKASAEEAALVNKAVGLESGDVLKVSGTKFTSYIPEKGMQVSYSSGGTLEGTVNTILQNKARKTTSSSSVSRSTPRRRGDD